MPDAKDVRIAELEALLAAKDERLAELGLEVEVLRADNDVLRSEMPVLRKRVEELTERFGKRIRQTIWENEEAGGMR